VIGKENVGITAVEPIGQYAVKLCSTTATTPDCSHWKYLHELGSQREQYWAAYRARVERSNPTG